MPKYTLDDIKYPNVDWKNYNAKQTEIISAEYKRRAKILYILNNDIVLARKLILVWKNDPVAFIMDTNFTYDPRRRSAKKIPFLLFERQKDYIDFIHGCYTDRADGVIQKCRDIGASWLNCAYSSWLYIFEPTVSVLWGSNKLELTHRLGDMGSLLERIDFIVEFLPKQIRPNHEKRHTKLINHTLKSTIVGQAGVNIGRGGRSSICFLDEAGFIENISKVEASLSMNTDCQIWLSTPNGMNKFWEKTKNPAFRLFTFNYFDDPRKDEKWYEYQKAKLDPAVFAQEVLIDYSGSVENQVIQPEWIDSAIKIELEASGARIVGFDIADEGKDKNAMVARYGSVVEKLDEWSGKGSYIYRSCARVWEWTVSNHYEKINYDAQGIGGDSRGHFNKLRKTSSFARIAVMPVKGLSVGEGTFKNTGRKKKDMFINERAWLWWDLRIRFLRTHEHYIGEQVHDIDDLISLDKSDPLIDSLMNELVSPTYLFNENGKIQIESKKSMEKRGVKSPNIGDALAYAFFPAGFDIKALTKR